MDRLKGRTIDCTLFESQSDVGGYWRTADSGKQSPRELYEFPGFPLELDDKEKNVQNYIQHFATERNIYPSCKLNTRVFSIVPNTKGWYVEYKDQVKDLSHTEKFDFVILCTGLDSEPQFCQLPNTDN